MSKATRMVTFVAPNPHDFKPTQYTGRVTHAYKDGSLKVNVAVMDGRTQYMNVDSRQVKVVR